MHAFFYTHCYCNMDDTVWTGFDRNQLGVKYFLLSSVSSSQPHLLLRPERATVNRVCLPLPLLSQESHHTQQTAQLQGSSLHYSYTHVQWVFPPCATMPICARAAPGSGRSPPRPEAITAELHFQAKSNRQRCPPGPV